MRYRLLGPTGLRVSELCLGTMTFGTDWGWGADEAECERIVAAYRDAAATSSTPRATTRTARASASSASSIAASATAGSSRQVHADARAGDPNAGGNHRKSLVRALEQSLRRLRTDYVDLLWVHMRDATTPIEEIVRALDDQVRPARCSTWASPTRPPGSRRARTRSPSCAAGRRSSPFRFRTARSRAIPSAR